MIRITSDITDEMWDNYVSSHDYGNIFQTTSMYHVYENTQNYTPIKLCAIDNNDKIVGVLLGVVIGELRGILGLGFVGSFSRRSIIQGGPLVSNGSLKISPKLLLEFDNIAHQKSLYTQVWNMFDTKDISLENYQFDEHLNFLIDLNCTEEEIWSRIHKSRRKNINRSNKSGVTIEEIDDINQLPVFYNLLEETYKNVSVPLADISLFESAYKELVPKKMARFILAKHEGKYIGCRAILTFKETIHDWYAGASNDALSLYPNDILVWNILQWGVNNNFKIFDFGGAGHPEQEYGPREFKRRFGGDLVNHGRYTHVHSPTKMKITDIGFKVYQKIK
ncbi:MAG: FemAB-related protein system-associated [Clostridia bacterium]|jgi:lipid II:glycine glycyltransferase (peptidoglycan interpeptide bridge formation enzyme)|nr:FemAB-related protein system-associated [Clostridia bacterium]